MSIKLISEKEKKSAFDPNLSNNDGKAAHHMRNGTGSSAGHLFSVFQTLTTRPAWWIGPSHHQHCLFWLRSASTQRGQICLITGESCTAGLKNWNDYQNTSIRSTHPDLHVHTSCIPWTHGFTTASNRAAPYPAFHAFRSRPSYRYLLNSNSTSQRKNRRPTHTPYTVQ